MVSLGTHLGGVCRYLSCLVRYVVSERRADAHQLAVLASSPYFNRAYYLQQYQDVAETGVDPVIHFLDFGAHENRNPSTQFDTQHYRRLHPSITETGVNPLLHYLGRFGVYAGPVVPLSKPQQRPDRSFAKYDDPAIGTPTQENAHKTPDVKLPAIIDYLRTLRDDELVSTINRIEAQVIAPRAKQHFKARAWTDLKKLSAIYLDTTRDHLGVLLVLGRGRLYAGDPEGASHVLASVARIAPDNAEAQLYCGVAHMRLGQMELALPSLRAAQRLDPSNINIKRELGAALRRTMKSARSEGERLAMADESASLLLEIFRLQPTPAAALAAARLLYEVKRYGECIALLDEVIQNRPEFAEHLALKSKALIGCGQVADALAVSEDLLRLAPDNQAAAFQLRTLRFLTGGEEAEGQTFANAILKEGKLVAFGALEGDGMRLTPASGSESLDGALSRSPSTWLRFLPDMPRQVTSRQLLSEIAENVDPRSGFLSHRGMHFWRREALLDLIRCGALDEGFANLQSFESIYGSTRRPFVNGATAIVMSRNGSYKFGGGEHFLESMADHYSTLGYSPIIVGTRPDLKGQSGEANGFRFCFIDESPAEMRRFFLETGTQLVHAISGTGLRVAEALNYMNIPYIYGIHYWREVLGHHDEDERFFDESDQPIPRAEFRYILSRATTVYVNSAFTRDVVERAFGVRCPIVFSVPKERMSL